jgi:hypothetical protein
MINLAYADLADELENYVGYTIVDSKTIDGYRDGSEEHDDFEGCDYDRKIIFSDGSYLVCAEYNYTYAYRPTAIILGKRISIGNKRFTD